MAASGSVRRISRPWRTARSAGRRPRRRSALIERNAPQRGPGALLDRGLELGVAGPRHRDEAAPLGEVGLDLLERARRYRVLVAERARRLEERALDLLEQRRHALGQPVEGDRLLGAGVATHATSPCPARRRAVRPRAAAARRAARARCTSSPACTGRGRRPRPALSAPAPRAPWPRTRRTPARSASLRQIGTTTAWIGATCGGSFKPWSSPWVMITAPIMRVVSPTRSATRTGACPARPGR